MSRVLKRRQFLQASLAAAASVGVSTVRASAVRTKRVFIKKILSR